MFYNTGLVAAQYHHLHPETFFIYVYKRKRALEKAARIVDGHLLEIGVRLTAYIDTACVQRYSGHFSSIFNSCTQKRAPEKAARIDGHLLEIAVR